MVVLLRALKVPARIVNGFQAGEYNEIGENYVIRGRDAHSWVEVWMQGTGWTPYDPTPASAEPLLRSHLSIVLGNYLDAFELFWAEWVVGYDDVIQVSLFRDLQDKAAQLSWMGQRRLYRTHGSPATEIAGSDGRHRSDGQRIASLDRDIHRGCTRSSAFCSSLPGRHNGSYG